MKPYYDLNRIPGKTFLSVLLFDAEEEVSALGQVGDLAVGHGALEHPETAVGMDELDPFIPKGGFRFLDGLGDFFGGFHLVDLDVDDAKPDPGLGPDFLEGLEVVLGPVGQLEDEVVGMEGVEKFKQGLPFSGLDGLSPVVTEAKVDRPGAIEGVKDPVDGLGGNRTMLGAARDVGLVHLEVRTREILDLLGQQVGDGERKERGLT